LAGNFSVCSILRFNASYTNLQVVNPPQEADVVVPAARVLSCAIRNGFRMKRADPIYQHTEKGKEVSWTGQFVDEITHALGACRVL
jgi:POT family proton-dependent oligopeptide transporter